MIFFNSIYQSLLDGYFPFMPQIAWIVEFTMLRPYYILTITTYKIVSITNK